MNGLWGRLSALLLLSVLADASPADLAAPVWILSASLATARYAHTSTLLSSGKVLVVGGIGATADLATAELYDPATGTFAPTGSLAVARSYHTATLLPSGKVLVVGGSNSFESGQYLASAELYDPATGTWSATGSLGTPRFQHTATLLPSGQVLVAGGNNAGVFLASAELYDPPSGIWAAVGSLASARYAHTATLLPSGKVLVAGGNGSPFGLLTSAELYDPATQTWTSTGSLATARHVHTATALPSGKVLVAGGGDNAGGFLASAELYDPEIGTWQATGSLGAARSFHSATLLPSGLLIAAGGFGGGAYLASAEVYDPATGAWSAAPPLAAARDFHAATLLPSGKVLVVGGSNGGDLRSAEVYDPGAGAFAATGSLSAPRHEHAATLLPSGKVLASGGMGSSGPVASAELYDPATGSWAGTGSLAVARALATSTLLPSGRVLVSGGSGGAAPVASCEVYDPAAGTWGATGPLLAARHSHTATLLPSGKVLVAGGSGAAGYLASAEVYDPATGNWSSTGSLAAPRALHTATLLSSGRVLVAGGSNGAEVASAEIYDPSTGTWTATRSLAAARHSHTATLLPSGKVLVAGGSDGTDLAAAELYDPASGTWTATGSLGTGRHSHSATLLVDGDVLVAGGSGATGPLSSAEVYRPASGTWVTTGSLGLARAGHSATLLYSGRVLLAGGSNTAPTGAAELFDEGRGAQPAWTPVLGAAPAAACPGNALALGGTLFTGVSEGSGGGFQSSATNRPLVQLARQDGEGPAYVAVSGYTSTSSSSSLATDILPGWYSLRVIVGAVPSPGRPFRVSPPPSISPSVINLPPMGTQSFTGVNGTGVYTWSLATNASGGAIDHGTGVYTAGPTGAVTDIVQLTDSLGNQATSRVNVSVGVTIAPAAPTVPPRGSQAFTASGGSGVGFVWSLATNASGGSIGGASGAYTAGATGGVTDVVQVVDSFGNTATASVAVGPGVAIAPPSPSTPPRGSLALSATGGSGTGYTWTLTASPSGGSIDAGSGAYTAGSTGSVTDVVRVTDSLGNTATASIAVGPGISITPPSPSTPPRGSVTLSATGGSATGYTWALATNASGGTIDASSGAYRAGSTGGVTDVARVTDSLGNTATASVAVGPGVSIAPSSASTPPRGSLALSATGGSGTGYTWTLTASPSGGSIDAGSGAYTAGSTGSVTDVAQVTDSLGNTATRSISVTAGVSISPAVATAAPRESRVFTASGGGGGGYAWSLATNASGGRIDATTGAYTAGPTGSVTDVVQVADLLGNLATRSVAVTAGVSIAPATATVPPRGSRTFSAGGGSGLGFTWSLATNASGGTIGAGSGAYAAGPTGSATDVVQVTDSLGNSATASVAVGPGVSITPSSPNTPPRGSLTLAAAGGSGTGYAWALATNASGGTIDSSSGAYRAGPTGGVTDVARVTDSLGNTASVSVAVGPGVSITPPSPSTPPRGSLTLSATGGSGAGYTWALATNASGGTINSSSGAYRAGPTGGVTDVARVTDSLGNTATASVAVGPGISIAPSLASAPPRGSLQLSATGGSGTGYAWTLTASPSGGRINAASGAYTAGPTAGVTDVAQVTDSLGNTATRSISVTTGVLISPPAATAAPKESKVFTASGGGGGGYTWLLATNASGGRIDATTGVYTAGPTGSVTDVVQAADLLGNVATSSVTVTAGVSVAPATVAVPPRGSRTFSAGGGSGLGFTWSLPTNASGGAIDAASGLYTAGPAGSATDVVQVTDSLGNNATASVAVGPGVSITPSSPGTPPRGGLTLAAAGGSGTGYTWSLATNASGGAIDGGSGAYIAGPTGGVSDVIQVTDSLGNVSAARVAVGPGVSIAPATASTPPRGSLALSAAGGSGLGFTWSLATNASGGTIDAGSGAYIAGPTGGVSDVVQVTDSLGNAATREVAVTAGVTVSPATAMLPPGGRQIFTATGGDGHYTWSLTTNASGGTVDAASGLYTAGPTAEVTDVVEVTDSLGNAATREVAVRTAVMAGAGCSCGTGDAGSLLLLPVVMLWADRLRRRRAHSTAMLALRRKTSPQRT